MLPSPAKVTLNMGFHSVRRLAKKLASFLCDGFKSGLDSASSFFPSSCLLVEKWRRERKGLRWCLCRIMVALCKPRWPSTALYQMAGCCGRNEKRGELAGFVPNGGVVIAAETEEVERGLR